MKRNKFQYRKIISYILLSLVLIVLDLSFTPQSNSWLYWEKDRKLTWNDFQGSPNMKDINTDEFKRAYINITGKENKEPDSVIITVLTVFKKNISWVKKDFAEDHDLWYAQMDFDVHEIYARKLTQVYSKMTFSEKEIINGKLEFFRDSMELEAKKKFRFIDDDIGSYYSTQEKSLQEKWNLKLKNELDSLETFSKKVVKLPWKK